MKTHFGQNSDFKHTLLHQKTLEMVVGGAFSIKCFDANEQSYRKYRKIGEWMSGNVVKMVHIAIHW